MELVVALCLIALFALMFHLYMKETGAGVYRRCRLWFGSGTGQFVVQCTAYALLILLIVFGTLTNDGTVYLAVQKVLVLPVFGMAFFGLRRWQAELALIEKPLRLQIVLPLVRGVCFVNLMLLVQWTPEKEWSPVEFAIIYPLYVLLIAYLWKDNRAPVEKKTTE